MVEKSFEDLRLFLAFLITKQFEREKKGFLKSGNAFNYSFPVEMFEKNLDLKFWQGVLSNYQVFNRCKCNQLEYRVCSTVFLKGKGDRVFSKNDFFILDSNIGIFIFHTDEKGYLSECELLFEEEIVPSFLTKLVKEFPSEEKESDRVLLEEVKQRRVYSVRELIDMFENEDLDCIEID